MIEDLKEHGIENILALRGDIPEGVRFPVEDRFRYACELVQEIRKHGDFLYRGSNVIRKGMWRTNIRKMISDI